jgi:hypothetical protein
MVRLNSKRDAWRRRRAKPVGLADLPSRLSRFAPSWLSRHSESAKLTPYSSCLARVPEAAKVSLADYPCRLSRLVLDSESIWIPDWFLVYFQHEKLKERILEMFFTRIRPPPLYIREDHSRLSFHLSNH